MKCNRSLELGELMSSLTQDRAAGLRNYKRPPRTGGDRTPDSKLGQSRLLGIFREAPDATIVSDAQGRIVLANRAARELAKTDPEGMWLEVAAEIWGELSDAAGHRIPAPEWPWTEGLRGKSTTRKECHLERFDGTYSDILFSCSPIRDAGEQVMGMVAMLTDITEHKRAELLLRESALQQERTRMAANLHDTLLQGLNAIVLQLEAAGQGVGESPDSTRHVQSALTVARESLAQARRWMWTFGHEALAEGELAPALTFLAKQLFADTSIRLHLSRRGAERELPRNIRDEMLRIGKEAMCNVLKHAQANRVNIEVAYKQGGVQLRVDDDGQGFAKLPRRTGQSGYGLFSMRTRAESLGGRVMVESRPGQGTRVVALLPLPAEFIRGSAA